MHQRTHGRHLRPYTGRRRVGVILGEGFLGSLPGLMMTFTLRPYAPDDFDMLYALDQACYAPGIAYSKRTLRWFLSLSGADCLVAEIGGEIAGFILSEQEGERAHLTTIDVPERSRRRGIGTALLSALERKLAARGVREVGLETATDNAAAIAFWHKHGYRTVGVLKRYYLDRLDAFAMHKTLTSPKET